MSRRNERLNGRSLSCELMVPGLRSFGPVILNGGLIMRMDVCLCIVLMFLVLSKSRILMPLV